MFVGLFGISVFSFGAQREFLVHYWDSLSTSIGVFTGLNLMHIMIFMDYNAFYSLGFFIFWALMGLFGCSPDSIWQKRWLFIILYMWHCGNCFVWDVGFLLLSQICMVTVVDNQVGLEKRTFFFIKGNEEAS